MPRYLISYDLDKPGAQNYARLERRLRELGARRVLFSQWVLAYLANAASLEEDFMQYIDPSTDGFLIVEMAEGNSAWNRLGISDNDFRAFLLG